MNIPTHADLVMMPFWILTTLAFSSCSLHHSPVSMKSQFMFACFPKSSCFVTSPLIRLTEIVTLCIPPFWSSIMSFSKSNESKHVLWVSTKSFCAGVVSTTWPFFKIEIASPGLPGSGISSIQYWPKRDVGTWTSYEFLIINFDNLTIFNSWIGCTQKCCCQRRCWWNYCIFFCWWHSIICWWRQSHQT